MFSSTPLINISYSRSKLRYFSTLLSKDVSIHDSENSKMVSYTCDIKFLKSQIEDLHPLKVLVNFLPRTTFASVALIYVFLRCSRRYPLEKHEAMMKEKRRPFTIQYFSRGKTNVTVKTAA